MPVCVNTCANAATSPIQVGMAGEGEGWIWMVTVGGAVSRMPPSFLVCEVGCVICRHHLEQLLDYDSQEAELPWNLFKDPLGEGFNHVGKLLRISDVAGVALHAQCNALAP